MHLGIYPFHSSSALISKMLLFVHFCAAKSFTKSDLPVIIQLNFSFMMIIFASGHEIALQLLFRDLQSGTMAYYFPFFFEVDFAQQKNNNEVKS